MDRELNTLSVEKLNIKENLKKVSIKEREYYMMKNQILLVNYLT